MSQDGKCSQAIFCLKRCIAHACAEVLSAKISFAFSVSRGHEKAVGRWRKETPSKSTLPKRGSVPTAEFKPSRAPEVAVADAVAEVKRLEAAIEVLGGDTCMQKVSRMHCAVHEPGPECFQSQSEWQPARCSSNGPRNGSSELKRC